MDNIQTANIVSFSRFDLSEAANTVPDILTVDADRFRDANPSFSCPDEGGCSELVYIKGSTLYGVERMATAVTFGEEAKQLPFYVESAGELIVEKKCRLQFDHPDGYILLLIEAGDGFLQYEEELYDCCENMALLIKNGTTAFVEAVANNISLRFLRFYSSSSHFLVDKCVGSLFPAGEINRYMMDICKEFDALNANSPYRFFNYLTNILTIFVSSQNSSKHLGGNRELVERIAAIMKTHYREKVNINDLAKDAYVSVYYLIRLFNEAFGMSPYEYLMNYRIYKAKEGLKNGDTVANVAESCGFGNANNFFRAFKKHTGITPKQFRNNAS